MEKLPFEYTGTDAKGGPMTGTLKAIDLKEAEALAKRLGCINPVVSLYSPHSPRKQAIGEPSAASVQQVGPAPQLLPAKIPWEPQKYNVSGFPQFEPEKLTQDHQRVEDNSRLAAMVSGLKENVQRQMDTINIKVRQTLFIGESQNILKEIEPLLSRQQGRILSVNMQPNHHGNMVFAIVVEHEIKHETKEK